MSKTLLNDIRNTSGAYAKMNIASNANDFWKRVFQYSYDYDKSYGLKYKDIDYDTVPEIEEEEYMFQILRNLANRELTGLSARNVVESFATANGDLIKLICNRDLDCGMSATSFNKCFPGLIPEFNVQLAKEEKPEKLKYPLWAQLKYDGVRVIAIKDKDVVTLRTRNGLSFSWPKLERALMKMPNNVMLDGEVISGRGALVDRTNVSGIVNSAIQGSPIQDFCELKFCVFDTMSASAFNANYCIEKYSERYMNARSIVLFAISEDCVEMSKYTVVCDAYQVNKMFEDTLEQGYEGLILKAPDHKYTFKRNKIWVKMKAIKDTDLKCIDIEEGEGKYVAMVGALVCQGIVEGKQITVRVGSGLSDEERRISNDYIGKTIEIQYNTVIQDSKTGNWSLFLPRFKQVRFDK